MIGESPRSNAGEAASSEDARRARLESLGASAASLAHELRSPLAAMELLAGLMKERLADPECQRILEELLVEQRQIATRVDACLGYVRSVPLKLRPTPLRALLQESWKLARSRVPFRGRVELAAGEELVVMLDADQLRTALVDLLVNALEALADSPPQEPAVWLGWSRLADHAVRIEIRDNGPGVPEAVQEQVFRPFFTTRPMGSGLGLAHAEKVVSSHGGELELTSRPGEGCRLRLLLPSRSPS